MSSTGGIVRECAPAKINLFLHITGRRADGMHLIDSLVVFAGVGDTVAVRAADEISLDYDGPMAGTLPPAGDNLVLQAARLLRRASGRQAGARIVLTKHLPVASGIGGGSADAAATLRALKQLWRVDIQASELAALALRLGADVPVCLAGGPARVSGIGEQLAPVSVPAPLHLVLVNPGVAVPTAEIFAAYAGDPPPAAAARVADWPRDPAQFAAQLAQCRNDLSAPATRLYPVVGEALAALASQPDCLLARMSGSGATCFGLFDAAAAAAAAAATVQGAHPDWWVVATAARRDRPGGAKR